MPLQGEGRNGPSKTRLRAMWRKEKRAHDDIAARIAWKAERGRGPGLDAETLGILEGFITGRKTPNCVSPSLWWEVCGEMNAEAAREEAKSAAAVLTERQHEA